MKFILSNSLLTIPWFKPTSLIWKKIMDELNSERFIAETSAQN